MTKTKIDYNKEFHDAYHEVCAIEDYIYKMIEKPENEYDKGFNRACNVILDDLIDPLRYRMGVRTEDDTDWIESEEEND